MRARAFMFAWPFAPASTPVVALRAARALLLGLWALMHLIAPIPTLHATQAYSEVAPNSYGQIYLSEVMSQPRSVPHAAGEWVELYNPGPEPINLRGWSLGAPGLDFHTIWQDVWVAPGAYIVMARDGDPSRNGGITADYIYVDLALAAWEHDLLLLNPDAQPVDSFSVPAVTLLPGGETRPARTGASAERSGFAPDQGWVYAHAPWSGSRGDWGSPGYGYTPPQPTPTPTLIPAATATATPVPTVGPPALLPTLYISEIMADPAAVYDEVGEWLELYNGGIEPVNLQGWTLADTRTDRHTITAELWLAAGHYIVLGRNVDPAQNGNVIVHYQYDKLTLANEADDLYLIAPWGDVMDWVEWGSHLGYPVRAGISLERTGWTHSTGWAYADATWPGSAGDRGSPGAPYVAPTPTPQPVAPTATPEVGPPTPLPTATAPPATAPRIRISELLIDPAAVADDMGEWIELVNLDTLPVNLMGWTLHDMRQDRHVIQHELWIQPGDYILLARHSDPAQNGGVQPHYMYTNLRLANEDDDLVLVAPWGAEVDRVAWGRSTGIAARAGMSLERTDWQQPAGWTYAHAPWPGSLGDWGSPNTAYFPPPAPLEPTSTPTTAIPQQPPAIFITELMIDPAAVPDHLGEWVELHNAGLERVNLLGWRLSDFGSDSHLIAQELWIDPGHYLVLARHGDPAQNGGVHPAYVYSGLQLANDDDALLLHTPWGTEADRAAWGGAVGPIRPGLSLERAHPYADHIWVAAMEAWSGSAGDFGTPGQAFQPRPVAPTPTPTFTAADQWLPSSQQSPLVIDQLYYRSSELEFVTLLNRSDSNISLEGYLIGDAERPGKQEGLYALPPAQLAPGELFVVARRADAFAGVWGRLPHAEMEATDARVPTLVRRSELASGSWALNDAGDELILLTPSLELADVVVFGDGDHGAVAVTGMLQAGPEESLQRVPGAWYPAVTDQRHRFLSAAADPFSTRTLPLGQSQLPIELGSGYLALWGSLGVPSTFSPDGYVPPHYLLAAAAANGLDFLAIADAEPYPDRLAIAYTSDHIDPAIIQLPAWRWQGTDGNRAIVYSHIKSSPATWEELLGIVGAYGGVIQAQGTLGSRTGQAAIVQADQVTAPGGTLPLYQTWQTAHAPLLPGGNSPPHLSGIAHPRARYTGLAVTHADAASILTALAQRRGWLASRPGIWLTLRADTHIWMGSTLPPANLVTLEIDYGDRFGAPAGLALWQNDRILHQLDAPPPNGRWTIQVPATPGAFLYVVATQLSGDFAITAPLHVADQQPARLLINEILPDPGQDHNGDGLIDSDDEFIELWNPNPYPVRLEGWQLSDERGDESPGHRFTFGPNQTINGDDRLLLWRTQTRVNLNNDRDWVRLLDAQGNEIDRIAWHMPQGRNKAIGRVPDGGEWTYGLDPTPGRPNQGPALVARQPAPPPASVPALPVPTPLPPTHGQATGPIGSLAAEKLRGLNENVEFRAQVTVPPSLFNSAIYVAEPARLDDGRELPIAGLGIQVYLRTGGVFPALEEGDWVLVRGRLRTHRGEMEVQIDLPDQVWRIGPAAPLAPLMVSPAQVGESLEGRLVTLRGTVVRWQGDSIYLADLDDPTAEPVRITVRSSLGWKRPFVQRGEIYQATGVVSQFAQRAPWNGGYRILVRYDSDIVKVEQ